MLPRRGQPHHKNGVRRTCYSRPASPCRNCPLTAVCQPDAGGVRRIYRSEHAALVEAQRQPMADQGAPRRRQRAGLVEHPFGTLKRWFGWDHLLVRGFHKVRAEMSLMVLGYNLIRVVNRLGVGPFRDNCARRTQVRSSQALAQLAA
ncbi:transposase [Candidatus Thiosymbion oneisti]|uniref:transposase n=1 Tax=Candidatus Thiosymbion oneisti TaxID=589554 RepID=UPI00159F0BDD|nr:transposase [Candidatus Thiosymbion oneisti]